MRTALTTGRIDDPKVGSLLLRYTLAKELNISPKEQDEMSYDLARDLVMVHGLCKELESNAIDGASKELKSKLK